MDTMVSLTMFQYHLLIRPTVRTWKEKRLLEENFETYSPLDLKLKTKSDQLHIAKYVAYGLRFYGIVWILVRQGPFLD